MRRDEREQVSRFRQGDPESFEAFYSSHGARVYRFCYRLCGRADDAEDLAQEVFVAAFQGLERFQGRSSIATWLYRIALYRWRRLYGTPRVETVPLDEETSAASPDPAPAGLARLSLTQALDSLPDALRQAFHLVKAEGLTYREAAAVLGVPQGTVQSRVHDAVVRLRALMAEEGGAFDAPAGDATAKDEDRPRSRGGRHVGLIAKPKAGE